MRHLWFETEIASREEVAIEYDQKLIEDWNLKLRTKNCLQTGHYLIVGDLLRAGPEILNVFGFGTAAQNELNKKITRIFKEHQVELETLPIIQQKVPSKVNVTFRSANTHQKKRKEIAPEESYWYERDKVDRENIAKNFDNVPFTLWHLNKRTENALIRKNCITVGDIIRADEKFSHSGSDFGVKALKEINLKVLELLKNPEKVLSTWTFPTLGKSSLDHPIWLDKLIDLPVVVTEAPISWLYLSSVEEQHLTNIELATIGDLIKYIENLICNNRTLNSTSKPIFVSTAKTLARLVGLLDKADEILWQKYWERIGITVLLGDYEPGATFQEILISLPKIIEEIVKLPTQGGNGEDRDWYIIKHRFMLERPDRMTLLDLGETFGLTRQRINQIEVRLLARLYVGLIKGNLIEKHYLVHPDILAAVKELISLGNIKTDECVMESTLLERIQRNTGFKMDQYKPIMELVLTLNGLERVELVANLEPIWGRISIRRKRWFEKLIGQLDRFLTRKMALPQQEIDILDWINKGLSEGEKINLSQVSELLRICSTVEQLPDGTYQGKFTFLKGRGNQVERILFEQKQMSTLSELASEINHRLACTTQPLVDAHKIGIQLVGDKRFTHQGNSGLWALSIWSDIETSTIAQLIEKCMQERNEPMTSREIFAYISARRQVSEKTIITYLFDKTRFTKIAVNYWVMANWKMETTKDDTVGEPSLAKLTGTC